MTKIQKEVMEPAQLADTQQSVANATDNDEVLVSKVLEWLMPWVEKTGGDGVLRSRNSCWCCSDQGCGGEYRCRRCSCKSD